MTQAKGAAVLNSLKPQKMEGLCYSEMVSLTSARLHIRAFWRFPFQINCAGLSKRIETLSLSKLDVFFFFLVESPPCEPEWEARTHQERGCGGKRVCSMTFLPLFQSPWGRESSVRVSLLWLLMSTFPERQPLFQGRVLVSYIHRHVSALTAAPDVSVHPQEIQPGGWLRSNVKTIIKKIERPR